MVAAYPSCPSVRLCAEWLSLAYEPCLDTACQHAKMMCSSPSHTVNSPPCYSGSSTVAPEKAGIQFQQSSNQNAPSPTSPTQSLPQNFGFVPNGIGGGSALPPSCLFFGGGGGASFFAGPPVLGDGGGLALDPEAKPLTLPEMLYF